jgi:hypothetical protein
MKNGLAGIQQMGSAAHWGILVLIFANFPLCH